MEELLKEILKELKEINNGIQVIVSNSNPVANNQTIDVEALHVETLVNIVKKVKEHNEYILSINKYLSAIQKSYLGFRFDETL